MIGGISHDTVDYSASLARVVVDLNTELAQPESNSDAAFDRLSGISNVIGSNGDDILRGTIFNNVLIGGDGNDKLFGEPTAVVDFAVVSDLLIGGKGNDILHGQQGNDRMEGGADDDEYFSIGTALVRTASSMQVEIRTYWNSKSRISWETEKSATTWSSTSRVARPSRSRNTTTVTLTTPST